VCDETLRHLLVCPGLVELRNHFRNSPEHGSVAGPDVQLVNFLIAIPQYPLHSSSRVKGDTAVEPDESVPSADSVGPPLTSFSSSSFVSCSSLYQGEVPGRRHHRDEADEVLPPRLCMWSRIAGDGLKWWMRI
jgi:hypothetical protein